MTETRALDLVDVRFEAGDDTGLIEGFAARFDEADSYGDVIERGAFAASLAEHRAAQTMPVMLWSHEPGDVIGRWEAIEETGEGLKVRGRLNLDVQRAREARSLVRSGAVTGLSIGFRVRQAAAGANGVRLVRAIELHEVSIVSLPAARRARVTSIRSAASAVEQEVRMDTSTPATAPDNKPASGTGSGDGDETALADLTKRIASIEEILARNEIRAQRPGATAKAATEGLETRAFTGFVRRGREALAADEVRALTVADDTAGGYLAPADFQTELLKNLVLISPVRQAARVMNTSSGSVILPKRTAAPTAGWVGELEDRPEATPAYGQVEIYVHEMAAYVDVSVKLLEDAAVNIASELSADLAEEFARLEGVAFLAGDGVKKPRGLMVHPDVASVANGNATTLQGDGLVSLMHALPAFYRNRGAWMMNAATIGAVRKLKNGTGDYLWRDSLADGNPPTLIGRPVIEAPDMDDVGSGTYPVLFGDVQSAYRIVDRVAVSILRDPYSQATKGLVRFHARRRTGGDVVKAEAVKKLHMAVS
ncbi:phage major capsid protein [Zavarzinia sp.]|uniref:phage major capsid protein n=1 Tax=Zavarzinia sp. TaxID=2027920 RepID=UPI003562E2F1